MGSAVEFSVCEGRFCVAKLPIDALPREPSSARFWCVIRDGDEVSVITEESFTAPCAQIERGWKGLKVKGPLDFALKGILVSLLNPLNEVGVSVFVLSTFSTDYILVKNEQLAEAVGALTGAGHRQIHG